MAYCDKCKKNPASVHVEELLNSTKYEYNLCTQCAQEFNADHSFDSFFKNFLGAMFSSQSETAEDKPAADPFEAACPSCGLTYTQFTQTSRFGCADCYEAFRSKIDLVLKNIQGGNRHEGKYPNTNSQELMLHKQLDELRTALTKAVTTEDYEQAAILRDKIKALSADKGGY